MPDIITSVNNDRLKAVSLLQNRKKARDEQGLFVIEGVRIVEDALISAPGRIKELFVNESFYNPGGTGKLPKPADLPVTVVSDNAFLKISETVSPQGVLAVVRKQEFTVDDILRDERVNERAGRAATGTGRKRLLILDDIQDPGNLGTMMRTAEAAGMDGVIMSRNTVEIYSPKATRSTMGSVFRVPFAYVGSLTDTLEQLKKEHFTVYGTCLDGAVRYDSISYAERSAIIIGNEGNGISDEVRAHIDRSILIPMYGEVESLNAAVAAAIVMYESQDFG